MSHIVCVDIIIHDLDLFKKTCKAIGLEFRENQKTFRWYNRWMNDYHGKDAAYMHGIDPKTYGNCEHACGVPNNKSAYEVGLMKNPKGAGYVLVWDSWNSGYGLMKVVGDNCDKLFQEYAKQVTLKELKAKGYTLSKTNAYDNGEIELEMTNYN